MATRDIGYLRTRLSWEDEGAQRSLEGFRQDLRSLRSEMNVLRSQGRNYTNSLKGLRQQADILNRTYRTQQERVKELRRRYEESRRVKGEDAKQTRELERQYNNAVAAMNRTEEQLKRINRAIEEQTNPWRRLGRSMKETGDRLQTIGRDMTDFGRTYTMRVTTPIVAGGTAMFKAAMDYESAFAGVRKTVDATEEQFDQLSRGIREMATEIPAAATEIAGVAESAGQLGIQTENILEFTRTMVDLGVATNMSSDQAATSLARLANITQMPQSEFDRLGSTIVELGNNLATTESEITEMALRLAGAGNQVGLTEAQILSFAGALSSVGIQAEAGGSAFSRVMLNIQKAVQTGSKDLNGFAKVAGMSTQEFVDAFEKDAASAIVAFIEGLGELQESGGGATRVLDELGLSEIRVRDSLLRASGAGDLFRRSLEMGSRAWQENNALANEAAQRYETTESQLKILWNRIKDVGIELGQALIPAVMDTIDAIQPLIRRVKEGAEAFSDMTEEQQQTILKAVALAAAVGPAAIAIGNLTAGIGGLLKAGGSLMTLLGRASGSGLLGRIGLLGISGGPVGLAIAGVGALSLGIYKLVRDSREAREVNLEYADSMREQADALEETVDRFDELRMQSGLTTEEFSRLVDITKELSAAQDPSRVQALQEEFNKLAEKSGLSNDELNEMVGLNDKIVEQSPSVEKSFTNQGNAVVEATDAVREYINSLREMTVEELYVERIKALENEKELREENKRLNEEIAEIESKINQFVDLRNLSEDQIKQRLEEINREMNTGLLTQEEYLELQKEQDLLLLLQNGKLGEGLDAMQKQREELIKKLEKNEEELQKVDEVNNAYIEALLIQAGINTEKGNGIELLDQEIEKLKEQKQQLQEKYKNQEISNSEYQEGIEKLDKEINNLEDVRKKIREAVGETGRQNRAVDDVNRQYSRMEREIRNIRSRQRGTNEEIDQGTDKARNMTRELDKDVKKNVEVDDRGTARKVQREAEKPATKNVTLRARWAGVQAGLRIALSGILRGFAKGTNFAPGGPALVGEEGPELARLGNRWAMLDFGIVDIPRGTQIFTHDETKKIVAALNRLPAYANGISYPGEADRVVQRLNETYAMRGMGDNRVVSLLQEIADGIRAGQVIVMDERIVGRILEKRITEIQERNRGRRERFAT